MFIKLKKEALKDFSVFVRLTASYILHLGQGLLILDLVYRQFPCLQSNSFCTVSIAKFYGFYLFKNTLETELVTHFSVNKIVTFY